MDAPAFRRKCFQLDMMVEHHEHGSGKIIAISGQGKRRLAKVEFFKDGSTHSYHLAFSPLVPSEFASDP